MAKWGLRRFLYNLGVSSDVQNGLDHHIPGHYWELENWVATPWDLTPLLCSEGWMSLYLKSFPGEYNVFLGHSSALTPFAKLSSQNNASLLFPQMIWFPKGGVEEEKGENVFSFLMNVKLTEPKVKLMDLTLVFSVEGDTWCLCSLSKHAYPLFYSILPESHWKAYHPGFLLGGGTTSQKLWPLSKNS